MKENLSVYSLNQPMWIYWWADNFKTRHAENDQLT